jgi:hypothetical protein
MVFLRLRVQLLEGVLGKEIWKSVMAIVLPIGELRNPKEARHQPKGNLPKLRHRDLRELQHIMLAIYSHKLMKHLLMGKMIILTMSHRAVFKIQKISVNLRGKSIVSAKNLKTLYWRSLPLHPSHLHILNLMQMVKVDRGWFLRFQFVILRRMCL